MSIIHRNGPLYLYDKNKLVPFQWAFPNDGTIRCCTSPGVEKIMVTTDDVQDLLNTSPEAYAALQSLLEDLEGNPSQLTNILNRLIKLEGTVNPQVNSLASLKLLTAMIDGSTILCKGLGLYRYDSSSSATADDFFIIAPNTVPGRWILIAETAMGFSPDTGTANTFILSLPGLTAYYTGMMVWFKASYANTGTCTINVNALGAKSLIRPGGIGLAAGDITAGSLICAVYDGTSFQIISNLATNLVHLTAIQTLTNKTLTSPTLNTPTINTPTITTPKMSSGTTINDANGNELIRFPAVVASAVNEITVNNSATGVAPSIQASGTDANVGLSIMSKGSSTIRMYVNNAISTVFDAFANAVNYLTTRSNVTGSAPTIEAGGTDTNIGIDVKTKGTGVFRTLVNGVVSFVVDTVASAVNYLTVKANTAGNAPTIAATGTDTNIDVNVVPKGTGRLKENGIAVIRQGEDYRPNILINGDFQVWQRGTSFTLPSNGKYSADRWGIWNYVDTNIKVYKSGRVLRVEEYNAVGGVGAYTPMYQNIEGYAEYAGKTLTLSCNLTLDTGVTASVSFYDGVTGYTTGAISTSGTKVVTGLISSNPTTLQVTITLYREGLAVGKGITVNWVKLEVNDHATPFIPRNYGEEFALCQRYYQRLISTTYPPAARMATTHLPGMNFQVTMRITPTITILSSGLGTIGKIAENSSGTDVGTNVSASSYANPNGISYVRSDTAIPDFTYGYSYIVIADAEI